MGQGRAPEPLSRFRSYQPHQLFVDLDVFNIFYVSAFGFLLNQPFVVIFSRVFLETICFNVSEEATKNQENASNAFGTKYIDLFYFGWLAS